MRLKACIKKLTLFKNGFTQIIIKQTLIKRLQDIVLLNHLKENIVEKLKS